MAEARDVAGRFMDAFNAHDEKAMLELNAENTVFEGPGDVHLEGSEAATGYAMNWLNAFPDAKVTIHNEIEAGDWIVQEFTFSGTHTAPMASPAGEIPATNRELNGRGAQVIRVEDGKVADTRLYFDQVDVLTQLGLMPEPATT